MEEETIVIKIPKVKKEMKESLKKEIEEFIKERIDKIMFFKKLEELTKNSEITDEDCIRWQRELRKKRLEELKEKGVI